ncbi:MAG: FUSC family protein [Acidimicrobiaceae bacterium]
MTAISETLRARGIWPLSTDNRLSLRAAFCLTSLIILGIIFHQRSYATAMALGTLWAIGQDGSDRWRQRGPRILGVAVAAGVGVFAGAEFVTHVAGPSAVVVLLGITALVAGVIEASMYSAQGMYLLIGVIIGAGLGFKDHIWQSALCFVLGAVWLYFVAAITDWRGYTKDQRYVLAHAFNVLAIRLCSADSDEAIRARTVRAMDAAQDAIGVVPLNKMSADAVALRQCLIVAMQLGEVSWYLNDKKIVAGQGLKSALHEVATCLKSSGAKQAVALLNNYATSLQGENVAVTRALKPPTSSVLPEGQSFKSTLRRLPMSDRIRFAVILSIAVVGATIVTHILDGPKGYWLPMSVAFIFRPDLGPVVKRALNRTAGTLAGVAIAAFVAFTGNQDWLLIVLCFIMAGGIPWAQKRSHAIVIMFFTPIIFVFISVLGPDTNLFWPRIVDTAIAAVIVLFIDYFIWLHAPSLRPQQLTEAAQIALDRYAEMTPSSDIMTRHLRRRRAIRAVLLARGSHAQTKTETHLHEALTETLPQRLNAMEARINKITVTLIEGHGDL